jgi:TatD DNase family protein
VLETDAPDIPPEWQAGGRNAPDQLPRIAQALAGLRGISLQQVVEATTNNAAAALPGLARIH